MGGEALGGAAVFGFLAPWHTALAEIPPIKRVLPPEGLEVPADVRERLASRLAATKKRMEAHQFEKLLPDVEIFTKAIELALIHREFYAPRDFAKADWALDEANQRLDSLDKGEAPWTKATGLVVRGYRSTIDGSAQPYGLVIPQDHDFQKRCPLYVWLHGRGDKNTDLHFLHERATKKGQISPPGAIVLHPFGRHCVGYKHAGETDVSEATFSVRDRYSVDDDRVVLIGFSMGGAGAWHLGAHFAHRYVAVSPGAGFAETARYQRLTPDIYPPWYEQKLWGQYDAPNYVRNLFNTNVVAYSGELDKQIQAARVMEEAFQAEGRQLTHLIGPGVEHKYEPATLAELMKRVGAAVANGRPKQPDGVHLQTRTLDYFHQGWVTVNRLGEHWADARVDAEIAGPKHLRVTTKNVVELLFSTWADMAGVVVEIDGDRVALSGTEATGLARRAVHLQKGRWKAGTLEQGWLSKDIMRHGPIDHAFKDPFVVVTPSGQSSNAGFQTWMEFELRHFRDRWRALMRAELPEARDVDVLDRANRTIVGNLILWGDAESNAVIRRYQDKFTDLVPLQSNKGKWEFGGLQFDGDRFVPAVIYPSPEFRGAYVVYNSGLTFREGHDRTNSLQNPKLPDWAIIDITQPPDAFAPGRIHDAGFFDEAWQLKGPVKGP
ncbi:MAG TPA: alpha/beta hydrolase-fold protein [Pirellulales bacterium]|nr:alpha/beta hydrolase-fold protein [Pirellulales bacterium]